MNVLYIGQSTPGTTSKMRAEQLKQILIPNRFEIIDTNEPFFKTIKVFRSFGFRYKKGPLIWNINQFIKEKLLSLNIDKFDLIWVDKAVFIQKKTTLILRQRAKTLVHFTPDMAFYSNKSRHFSKSLKLYDFVISTKTKEAELYIQHIHSQKFIATTQGFDLNYHKPLYPFAQKETKIAFIGLAEPSRFKIIQKLIETGIRVKLAGKGWNDFVKKNDKNKNLEFVSESLINEAYADFISSAQFSVGMLSKKIPELHTTRTFEIPACSTALITERNSETKSFFTEEEALFYDTTEEMISKIKYYQNHPEKLELLIAKGRDRVIKDGRDYKSIIEGILQRIGIDFCKHY